MTSKADYIRKKLQLDQLERAPDSWWAGVTNPYPPECSRCREDMSRFMEQVKRYKHQSSGKLQFIVKCGPGCIWWDWFDRKRKDMGMDIVYTHGDKSNT
jgi:hypothetical protein